MKTFDRIRESFQLDEAIRGGDTKTFKTLEDWLTAVLSIKGASVSKFGNNLTAGGLGRTQSATFDLKKGRGSLLESVNESVDESLEESKMKDFHDMVKKGMTAAQIAKKIGMKEKDVADFMKSSNGMKESVDLEEGKLPPHLAKFFDKNGNLNKDAEERVKKGRKAKGLDPRTGKKVKESVEESNTFSSFRESLSERKDSAADLYFDTYSAAVQHAKAQAEKKGFEVVEDDWFTQVTTGKGKPGRGKTTRHTLKLTKNDKPVRKSLAIQVYNRDTNKNTYELNMYIS